MSSNTKWFIGLYFAGLATYTIIECLLHGITALLQHI